MIYAPKHPGKIIYEILIEGAKLSVKDAANKLDIDRTTLSRLINSHISISPIMALRLSKLLPNTNMAFWLKLQMDYDIVNTTRKNTKMKIKPLAA
jgi:addiction module HigA family antidote